MAEWIKNIATMFPGPSSLQGYFRKNGPEVFFPFYHAISDSVLPHMKHLYTLRSREQFAEDLDYLLESFVPVKLSEYLSGTMPLDTNRIPMVLSFDDGLIQCYSDIMPVLLEKGIPAVFFLNNAFIDNKAMFFRYKVSLLIEAMEEANEAKLKKAAELLHCETSELKKRLLAVSYVEREITDQVADVFEYSYSEYLRQQPIYLSSMHIRKMMDEGFEFGSHGIDHPLFSLLKQKTTIDHIQSSVAGLSKQYKLDYKYFAFPFTDSGVEDATIEQLFQKGIIDAGFGTAGLKDDKWEKYFQRVPMEMLDKNARETLRGEVNRRRLRKFTGKNITRR